MEFQRAPNNQNKFEKIFWKFWERKTHTFWFQNLLQSYRSQNSVALAYE